MNRVGIVFSQLVVCFSLGVLYNNAPSEVNGGYIFGCLLLVLCSIFLMQFNSKNRMLKGNPFTVTNFFLIGLSITSFQIPVEYLLDSFSHVKFQEYFFDLSIVNASVCFSSIAISVFSLGQLSIANVQKKIGDNPTASFNQSSRIRINLAPFITITILLFILHIATVDFRYYLGGYSQYSISGLSLVAHGYLMRFIVVSFFLVMWNYKLKSMNGPNKLSMIKYLRIFPTKLLIVIGVLFVLTFLSGDRGVLIRIMLLMAFGFFIVSRTKIRYITFVIVVVTVGFVFSIAKLVGGYSEQESYVSSFQQAQERFAVSDRSQSVSPYTLELAGSIYSNNILFSLWRSGVSLQGAGVIAGVLMAFPGGVSLFSAVTGLSNETVNSSNLATVISNQDYGVGTSIVGDALINVGLLGALFSFFVLGRLFRIVDVNLYKSNPNFEYLLLGCIFIAEAIILPRASMFNLIGVFVFDYLIIKLLIGIYSKSLIKQSNTLPN